MSATGMTREELLNLPVVIDLETAARALQIGRTKAYFLAKHDQFPCRVHRIGEAYRIPTADLLVYLGILPPSSAVDQLDESVETASQRIRPA